MTKAIRERIDAAADEAARITDAAIEIKERLYGDWTIDELLCNPDEAKDLCVQVRRRTSSKAKDRQILHALLNARKRSRVH